MGKETDLSGWIRLRFCHRRGHSYSIISAGSRAGCRGMMWFFRNSRIERLWSIYRVTSFFFTNMQAISKDR
jgi:hypothetical protein